MQSLQKHKEECQKVIQELSHTYDRRDGKLVKTREQEEAEKDLAKIEEELETVSQDKEEITKLLQEKEKVKDSESSLLKDKKQLEEAIAQISGKMTYENGKMVKTQEQLKYERDLENVNEKLKPILSINEKLEEYMKKYDVKDKNKDKSPSSKNSKPQATNTKDDKSDDFQPPAVRDNEKDDFQPPAVVDDERDFQPPAVIIDEERPTEEQPNEEQPTEEQPNEETQEGPTLPRHWVEIMAETQTQSTGSVMQYFHNMGKIEPFRLGMTIWAAPVKLAMKGIGKLVGDVAGKVEDKQQQMVENIRNLPPEEYETLIKGLSETNVRQYKVNENYLEAVLTVLREREAPKKQQAIENDEVVKAAIDEIRADRNELMERLNAPGLTEDQELDIKAQIERNNMVEWQLIMQHHHEYNNQKESDDKITNLERAKTGKSTSKMNIQGWLAGSFNPDNRQLHQQMAELYKQRREATDAGDLQTVNSVNQKLQELKRASTKEVKLLPGTRFDERFTISRGEHKVEEAHKKPSDASQNKARELIGSIMVGVSAIHIARSFDATSQQQQVDNYIAAQQNKIDQVNSHNDTVQQEINQANTDNANLENQIHTAKTVVTKQNLEDAAKTQTAMNNGMRYAGEHNEEFLNSNNGVGFDHNGSDTHLHADQAVMTQARQTAENGNTNDMVQHAEDTFKEAQKVAKDVLNTESNFTSMPGKAIFDNSEYIDNLKTIISSSDSGITFLKKLFTEVSKMSDPTQITGKIQHVSDLDPLVLQGSMKSVTDWLPFMVSMGNIAQIEARKAQILKERQAQRGREEQRGREQEEQENEQQEEQGDDDGR